MHSQSLSGCAQRFQSCQEGCASQTSHTRRIVDEEFFHNEAKWKARLRPFVAAPGERRPATIRNAASEQTAETYDGDEEVQELLRLNMRHYTSWRVFWDRVDPQRAEGDFWALLEDADTEAENSQGEPTVWVKDIARRRSFRGTRQGHMKKNRAASPTSPEPGADAPPRPRRHRSISNESGDDRRQPDVGAKRRRCRVKRAGIVKGDSSDDDGGLDADAAAINSTVGCVSGGVWDVGQ